MSIENVDNLKKIGLKFMKRYEGTIRNFAGTDKEGDLVYFIEVSSINRKNNVFGHVEDDNKYNLRDEVLIELTGAVCKGDHYDMHGRIIESQENPRSDERKPKPHSYYRNRKRKGLA